MLVTDDGTKAPISRVFVHDGPWFHSNFSARAKNDDSGNRVVQFYAEIFYAETPHVMRCCVLTNVAGTVHMLANYLVVSVASYGRAK